MTDIRRLFESRNRGLLFRLILVLLVFALVPLAEVFLFIYLGDLIGNYLVLVIAAVAGIVGALVVVGQLRRARARLRAKLAARKYPGAEYVELAGLFVSAVLLITPGFITDLLGFLLLIPALRAAAGRLIVGKLARSFPEVYENLRLSAL
jgi:UPF0716 protein FxsA